MDENLWESVPEAFDADLTLQESFDLAVAKVHRYKAASIEAGIAIRKALPVGCRVQHGIGEHAWTGTIISPQGALCDHLAGPVSVLPYDTTALEPDVTTGEVMVDVLELTALSGEKWHWMNQAIRLAHAATHLANSAAIEAEVAIHRMLLVGRLVEVSPGEQPAGAHCRGEVVAIGPFCTTLHVRFDGRQYDPDDVCGDVVEIDRVRRLLDAAT
jgi:hypothetical protein